MAYNLIIPMAGQGKRFIRAGYKDYKPFIKINGKFMIDHVIDSFPETVNIQVITSNNLLTEQQEDYLKEAGCNIIYIENHSKGPAYSIYQARNELNLKEGFFISYVDIFWNWDWKSIQKQLDQEGIIFTHRGFHPHLVDNNFSAFCSSDLNNQGNFLAIREKESFTDNWMDEYLSIGLFYVKTGEWMINAISAMINNKEMVNGEFFPSLIYNYLKTDGKSIKLVDVDSFIHWGVPEQLNDYLAWGKKIIHKEVPENEYPSVMTMAGVGLRMKDLSQKPKALIPIHNKPMFKFVFDKFNSKDKSLITTDAVMSDIQDSHGFNCYILPKQTSSQFDTILSSEEFLLTQKEFFLLSCDSYGLFDANEFRSFVDEYQPDAVIFSFHPTLIQQKLLSQHTHISYRENAVTEIHIKSKSSDNDLGLAGFFWVRNGKDIVSTHEIIHCNNTELTADHIFKQMIKDNYNILKYDLDHYVHLGSFTEFKEFQYWNSRKEFFTMSNIM